VSAAGEQTDRLDDPSPARNIQKSVVWLATHRTIPPAFARPRNPTRIRHPERLRDPTGSVNVQSTVSFHPVGTIGQTNNRSTEYLEVGSMSDHVSRRQLKRIMVGAISLQILTCMATNAAARYFVA
jgi:hypothetical protein